MYQRTWIQTHRFQTHPLTNMIRPMTANTESKIKRRNKNKIILIT